MLIFPYARIMLTFPCIVLYCIILYCIILYCIVLYCIVLYCIVLIALSRCNRVFTRRLRLCHSHTVRHREVRKGEREGLNRVVRDAKL